MVRLVALALFAIISTVNSLHLEDSEEGTCHQLHFQPLPNGDFNFIDRFKYLSAGNRYYMYAMASGHPRFDEMREFEMYYNLCLSHNATMSSRQASSIGFGGRELHRYTFRPRRNQPAILDVTAVPTNNIYSRREQFSRADGGFTKTVTFTDHKTFAFVVTCWEGRDLASWIVFSLTPELSPSAKRQIQQHAVSLGFSREDTVFLNYNICGGDIGDDTEEHHWSLLPLPVGSGGTGNRLVRNHASSNQQPQTIGSSSGNTGWSR